MGFELTIRSVRVEVFLYTTLCTLTQTKPMLTHRIWEGVRLIGLLLRLHAVARHGGGWEN